MKYHTRVIKKIRKMGENQIRQDIFQIDSQIENAPINIHNVGVFYPKYFQHRDVFDQVSRHKFHNLRQSTKDGVAYRTGVYISPCRYLKSQSSDSDQSQSECDCDSDSYIETHLLRCSTNFPGPTENTMEIDNELIAAAQVAVNECFTERVELNHVLAQIYWNTTFTKKSGIEVPRKARIVAHSDKTKDMPRNAVMAFASFYQGYDSETECFQIDGVKKSKTDPFDYTFEGKSVLSSLKFTLKTQCDSLKSYCLKDTFSGGEKAFSGSEKEKSFKQYVFTVKLYPNSLFIIPLSTNRMYLHETVPPNVPIDKIPVRMGYVIRCSKTRVLYTPNIPRIQPRIVMDDSINETITRSIPMHEMTETERVELGTLYRRENATCDIIDYPLFLSSMNEGDYMTPE